MSMNLILEGMKDNNLIQTPTEVTVQILNSNNPKEAYLNWVFEKCKSSVNKGEIINFLYDENKRLPDNINKTEDNVKHYLENIRYYEEKEKLEELEENNTLKFGMI